MFHFQKKTPKWRIQSFTALFLSLVILLGFALRSPSQTEQSRSARERGQRIREAMLIALPSINELIGEPAFQMRQDSSEFQRLSRAIANSQRYAHAIWETKIEYSNGFLVGMDYDLKAFQDCYLRAQSKDRINTSVIDEVVAAEADLSLKAKIIAGCNIEDVETTVNTRDIQGLPVSNCIVWYAEIRDKQATEKFRFDNFSTPTTDRIPAGSWQMWSEKDGKYGNKTTFRCGGNDCRISRTNNISAP